MINRARNADSQPPKDDSEAPHTSAAASDPFPVMLKHPDKANPRDKSYDFDYTPDIQDAPHTLFGIAAAILGGGLFTLISWFILKQVNLPAFGPSLVTRALATVCTLLVVLAVTALMIWWVHYEKTNQKRPRWFTWLTYAVTYLSPAGLIVASLGIPLSPTKLYLDGLTVDQVFRTQYMTRLTDSWHLTDMNYIDLPAYYPGAWFWFGGRLGALLGLPGWEVFQPYSLISLSMAGCLLVPVWQRIIGSLPVATGIALVTTTVALVMCAEEPYACVIAMGIPAAVIIGRRALSGRKSAILAIIFYLGISASMYTLYTAIIALSLIAISGVILALILRSWKPIGRIVLIGVASMAIAAIAWGPYFTFLLSGKHTSGATASHFLPVEGTEIPLPMFAASIIGVLCMLGLIYLLARAADPDINSLGVAVVVSYIWVIASMAVTLTGSTLLGFRLDPVITIILATAGVLAIADFRLVGIHRLYPVQFSPSTSRQITMVIAIVVALGGIKYAQDIPAKNSHSIDHAYSSTDGNGERADRYPADATQYYASIDAILREKGSIPRETVVLTDEMNFMAYYPYRGFQAFTSHYANPLGEFNERNKKIEQWAMDSWQQLKDPQAFDDALHSTPWKAPEAFIFRADATAEKSSGWNFDLAEDIYPNNPNVRFRGVKINPEVFTGKDTPWKVNQVGPFVVVTRG